MHLFKSIHDRPFNPHCFGVAGVSLSPPQFSSPQYHTDISRVDCKQYGPTALQHIGGRAGEGRAEVAAFLKMKTAAHAVIAANKFKAKMAAKGKEAKEASEQPSQ